MGRDLSEVVKATSKGVQCMEILDGLSYGARYMIGVRGCSLLGRTPRSDRPEGFSRWQSPAQQGDVFKCCVC